MLASIGKGHYGAAFDTGMDMLVPFISEAKCVPPSFSPVLRTVSFDGIQVLHYALIFLVPTCRFSSLTFRAVACLDELMPF